MSTIHLFDVVNMSTIHLFDVVNMSTIHLFDVVCVLGWYVAAQPDEVEERGDCPHGLPLIYVRVLIIMHSAPDNNIQRHTLRLA